MHSLLQNYQNLKTQRQIAENITFTEVTNDKKTTLTKMNSVVQVIKLEGKNYSGVEYEKVAAFFEKRKAFFNTLGEDLTLTIFSMRKQLNMQNETVELKNDNANRVAKKRNEAFKEVYRTEIFIMVRLPLLHGVMDKLGLGSSADYSLEKEKIALRRQELDAKVSEIVRFLEDYNPQVVMHQPQKPENLNTFWSYLANVGKTLKVNDNEKYLGETLGLTDIEFLRKEGTIKLHDIDGTRYAAILSLNIYPQETHSKMLDMLMQIRHPFTIIQQIQPQDKEVTKENIYKKINNAVSLSNASGKAFMQTTVDELSHLGENVESDTVNITRHALSILIYGKTAEHLEEGIRKVRVALNPHGIGIVREKMHLENAFWSQFPDNEAHNTPRRFPVTTDNVADFINFSTSYEGLSKCAFGNKPTAVFKTREDTQFSFTFHESPEVGASGHTIYIGSTGSGKSVLAMFLAMNCLKYDDPQFGAPFKALMFDSLGGLFIPTISFGGKYIDAGTPKEIPMNPLQLKDTPANRAFLEEFLAMLAGGQAELSEQDRKTISKAIAENFNLDVSQREIAALKSVLSSKVESGDNLYNRLSRWAMKEAGSSTGNSPLAQYFNHPNDALNLNKRLMAFDMAHCLKSPEKLIPLASYIFHNFHESITKDPAPHLFFIDEMQQYVQNEIFGEHILKIVREVRKRNGVFMGATQEPSVLLNTETGRSIKQGTKTYIVSPNSQADPEEYAALGFENAEIDWIRTATTKYEVMIKRTSGQSVIINTDLSGLGEDLNLFSSNLQDVALMKSIIKDHPENFVEVYLETKKKRKVFS